MHLLVPVVAFASSIAACTPPVENPDDTGSSDTSDTNGSSTTTTAMTSTADATDTTEDSADTSSSDETGPEAVCGNGAVEDGEECDDGNADETDDCTSLCTHPACDDTILSGDETDVDCGGSCSPCSDGSSCISDSDCENMSCLAGTCAFPTTCAEVTGADGIYTIDPDGVGGEEPYEVMCEMSTVGGGWTLILVTSDDGTDTWTWDNRLLLTTDTTVVGDVNTLDADFKSPAYHDIAFGEMLFVHAPSDVWAMYPVSDGTADFGTYLASLPERVCDYELAGDGIELADGTLMTMGNLCDTDLYFNLGDHGLNLNNCQSNGYASSESYGPNWSGGFNDSCPFDDPGFTGIGPDGGGYGEDIEIPGAGFGFAAGLNTGTEDSGENNLRVYVR